MILSLGNNQAFAVQNPVIFLTKDSPAPYEGYLFSKEATLDLRKKIIENEYNAPIIESFNRSLELKNQESKLKDQQISNLLQQNTQYSQIHATEETNKWIYFGLGILTAIATAYVYQKASK